tara:strand:+ start:1405 stop:2109 length:705 start_codon:yes stop_codon:yes gene_type:complete
LLVLIVGSAPDALQSKFLERDYFDQLLVINNAWNIREDWNYCIFPDDFPENRRPTDKDGQRLITSEQYVPVQNKYGGFVYSGGTMAFTAGYWALGYFQPKTLVYVGCDMIYEGKKTHFYGKGTADPLRKDPTLKNLKAKSARLEAIAASQGCSIFNLSKKASSNLIFRRINLASMSKEDKPRNIDVTLLEQALQYEKNLGYYIEDGKYWKYLADFDQEKINYLDQIWCKVISQN